MTKEIISECCAYPITNGFCNSCKEHAEGEVIELPEQPVKWETSTPQEEPSDEPLDDVERFEQPKNDE